MAFINNIYIFVKEESVNRALEVSEHPVEKGIHITDHVKREPKTISVSGELVGKHAKQHLKKLENYQKKGKLVSYIGINKLKTAIITKFDTSHTNTIWGGCAVDMEIKEIRIAKSPYKKTQKKKIGLKQIAERTACTIITHNVKTGETLYSIMQKYKAKGCTMEKIKKENPELNKNWKNHGLGILKAGTKIKVADRK